MITPADDKVLIEVLACNNAPGLIVDERDEKSFSGIIREVGKNIDESLKGCKIYFRYHFGFILPDIEPETMVLDYKNILAFESVE